MGYGGDAGRRYRRVRRGVHAGAPGAAESLVGDDGGALALAAASARAWLLMYDRFPFIYRPFLTYASGVAASVLVAWMVVASLAPSVVAGLMESEGGAVAPSAVQVAVVAQVMRAAPWCWAFLVGAPRAGGRL